MTIHSPMSPRVAVALCTCNGGRFVLQQLQSIGAQTHPVTKIIACDDESTDDTIQILQSFAAQSGMAMDIVENPQRLGVTKNFENAISRCDGEIIVLCDQDDVWHPDKIGMLLEAMAATSANMAFSNAQVVVRDMSPAGYRLWESIWFTRSEQLAMRNGNAVPVLLRHAVAAGSTLAFKSEMLPLILPIPDLPHCHDVWITLLLACVGRVEPVDLDLIQYRLHESNTVGMRRYNLLGQIRMAKQQIKSGAFAQLAELYESAYKRLSSQSRWPVTPETLRLLREKIEHSHARDQLPRRGLKRMAIIRDELRRGNYAKYSYGFKSVLQDLFLR